MLKRRLIRCMKFILSKEMLQFLLTISIVFLLFFNLESISGNKRIFTIKI